jgi:VWFA-related protein
MNAMRSRRYRRFASFAVLFFLSSVAHGASPEDAAVPAYRSTAAEVRITFFATDQTDHVVDSITRDDFAIVDGDLVIRQFRSLARSEKVGIRAVMLIDSSESVATRLPATMRQLTRMLSQSQLAASDISVVSFSNLQPVLLCDGDCATQGAIQRLLSLTASGATPLFDAIAYSAPLLSRHAPGVRPVLILFSDGDDTISRVSASEAFQALTNSGALLYAVDMNSAGRSDGSAVLRQVAEASGGLYFPSANDALTVLPSIFGDVRSSWVVTYQLPDTTFGFHSLRILPKHNLSLRFHCRSGYYYGTRTP